MINHNMSEQKIILHVGANRKAMEWIPEALTFDQLAERLKTTTRTKEPFAEYMGMTREQQGSIKDVGGYFCGALKGNRRNNSTVLNRSLITLDADNVPAGIDIGAYVKEKLGQYVHIFHSTHKHARNSPRGRVLLLPNRIIKPDEYEVVSRYIARLLGESMVDKTCHEPSRFMYYPSTSADGEYLYDYNSGGSLVDVDAILEQCGAWVELTEERKDKLLTVTNKKQAAPAGKSGVIGTFCRIFDVHAAIAKFLPDKYSPCDDGRYTWVEGSSAGGAVVYDDSFLYSHHATDPCGGKLVNAFDLVRIHNFSELDADEIGIDANGINSLHAMIEFSMECIGEALAERMDKIKTEPEIKRIDYFRENIKELLMLMEPIDQGRYIKQLAKILEVDQRDIRAEMDQEELSQEGFFTKKGVFIPLRMVNFLLTKNHFALNQDSIYLYKDGYYQPVDSEYIKNMCQELLKERYTDIRGREIAAQIKTKLSNSAITMDTDTRYINAINGLIDISGDSPKLTGHTPHVLSSLRIPVVYDPSATCAVIDQFFKDVLPADCIELAEELIGDILIPGLKYQKVTVLLSDGESGKSTFLNLITKFIGKTNTSNESLQALSENQFRLANLYGKLANILGDISDRLIEDSSLLKQLTGGDSLTGERKNRDSFNFVNQAKLLFSANALPRTRDKSHGYFRRWTIMRFPNKFTVGDPRRDSNIDTKIQDERELSGLLNVALKGLYRLRARGSYEQPASTKAELEKYMLENDTVKQFFIEMCMEVEKSTVSQDTLYSEYKYFCNDNGSKPVNKTNFMKTFRTYATQAKINNRKGRTWVGILVKGGLEDVRDDILS